MSDVAQARNGKKVRKDLYTNVAFQRLTMSAANTLTFQQIQFGVGIFQGVALILNRIGYVLSPATIREIAAVTDYIAFGLVSSNRLTGVNLARDPAVISSISLIGVSAAPPTSLVQMPIWADFTNLPGGGRLVAANPLYLAMEGAGMAAAGVIDVELDFQFVQLSDAEYLELIQSQYPANIS